MQSNEIGNIFARRAYLLGRIEEANYWIDYYSSQKSKLAKKKLKEAKALRDKDISELKEIS